MIALTAESYALKNDCMILEPLKGHIVLFNRVIELQLIGIILAGERMTCHMNHNLGAVPLICR